VRYIHSILVYVLHQLVLSVEQNSKLSYLSSSVFASHKIIFLYLFVRVFS